MCSSLGTLQDLHAIAQGALLRRYSGIHTDEGGRCLSCDADIPVLHAAGKAAADDAAQNQVGYRARGYSEYCYCTHALPAARRAFLGNRIKGSLRTLIHMGTLGTGHRCGRTCPSVVPSVSLPRLVTHAHWHPPAALAAAHSHSRLQGRFVNELDKRRARLDLKRQQLVESRLLTTKKDTPVGRRRPVSAQDPTSEWTGSTPLEPWVLSADEEKRGASSLLPELAPAPYSAKWDA